jgi:hypothetical protein
MNNKRERGKKAFTMQNLLGNSTPSEDISKSCFRGKAEQTHRYTFKSTFMSTRNLNSQPETQVFIAKPDT